MRAGLELFGRTTGAAERPTAQRSKDTDRAVEVQSRGPQRGDTRAISSPVLLAQVAGSEWAADLPGRAPQQAPLQCFALSALPLPWWWWWW